MPARVAASDFSLADLPEGRALVLFVADWCGYCHRFLPHFRRLGGTIVDVTDEDDPLWDALALRVVPTVVLFEGRAPRRRWAGALSAEDAEEMRRAFVAPEAEG
ncbi:MAG TPA: thioredoxin family protein [Candidatus Thermoplasmatota archaeon]|nr:thioredoxin family protein [Candidatus Thermoplasmatota archaeon]